MQRISWLMFLRFEIETSIEAKRMIQKLIDKQDNIGFASYSFVIGCE